jgi:hypothetical protein
MAERVDGPALHEVEIVAPGFIPEVGAVASLHHERWASHDRHQGALEVVRVCRFARA